MADLWNRCDECGRFIPLDDFVSGKAIHRLLEPSSDLGVERFETLCHMHVAPDPHCQHGIDIQEAMCSACGTGELAPT